MPRIARVVAVNLPHHVTQRGNNQQEVFAEKEDYELYLSWLGEYSRKASLEIWAYCLMTNHVHFVVVPRKHDSMARTFDTLHTRYSQYFNRKTHQRGHLWQSRFYSCVLDERHLYAAVRYVEKNPVRAGLVNYAEYYPWSSAPVHVSKLPTKLLYMDCPLIQNITNWAEFLSGQEDQKVLESLRDNTISGRPSGDEEFLKHIENMVGRSFKLHPRGRPKKVEGD